MVGCCDRRRRDAVATRSTLNGIDYVEVVDGELPADDPRRQRTLLLTCLRPVTSLGQDNVVITGGERIPAPAVDWALPAPAAASTVLVGEPDLRAIVQPLDDRVLIIRTRQTGDFSLYRLRLCVDAGHADDPPDGFDPRLCEVELSFKAACDVDLDCQPATACPPAATEPPPEIDYLAKDYRGFRRLLLDRLSQLAPDWTASSVADQGVMLAELLAYVGDHLSYQQDAVATEAYLGTARRRVSLRRHAALVDYPMHDGCTARAWVHVALAQPDPASPVSLTIPRDQMQLLTRCDGVAAGIAAGSPALTTALLDRPTVFEPLEDAVLSSQHNELPFHTWGDDRCCLPAGATAATLAGHFPGLAPGDVLLFEEVKGPLTGEPADADPRHRQVVRLTSVRTFAASSQPDQVPLTDPLDGTRITEIAWAVADALPFPLCLSSVTDDGHGGAPLADVSVARGNLVLVDHGQTIRDEPLDAVPAPRLFTAPAPGGDRCQPARRQAVPARFRPQLAQAPLSQAGTVVVVKAMPGGDVRRDNVPFDRTAPAAEAMSFSMEDVLPQIWLTELGAEATRWRPRRTLLGSESSAEEFVAEVEDDGRALLRFGDDQHGQRPKTGTVFSATYRIGNGAAGNVGAETIQHVVLGGGAAALVQRVRNPLGATGGVDPETAESVRRNAPQAFRVQERAVNPDDYARVTERQDGVQRATAALRWTGSWHTVFVAVDPRAGTDAGALTGALPQYLDRFRMAGHDVDVRAPVYVSLAVVLDVCVAPDAFRSQVRARLLEALGSGTRADGRRGFFHPDNFTFGQPVFLSALYAATRAVAGLQSVKVIGFGPQGDADPSFLLQGQIPIGPQQIARLANDRNFPERGVLRLDLHGGK